MVRLEMESQKSPIRELLLIKKSQVMDDVIKEKFLFFEGLFSFSGFHDSSPL